MALREVQEESGLTPSDVRPVSPKTLEILTVDGHEKHGRYVSSHLHLNDLSSAGSNLPHPSTPGRARTAG